jgi:hypothetical protein
MFQDWEKKIKGNPQVSKHLLWDFKLTDFDWEKMKVIVVQRVVERGRENDYYAIFNLYGGVEGVREIIIQIPEILSPRNESFVKTVFNLKKEDLQCYRRKRLRERLLNS